MGWIRIDGPDGERCPKCGAENIGKKIYIKRQADGRGPWNVCDGCGYGWPVTPTNVTTTVKP
jgi:hypothetical protein